MLQGAVGPRFGTYGGRYVGEALVTAIDTLAEEYESAQSDVVFQQRLAALLHDYAGRPTPFTEAGRLSEHLGGATVLLKREDLNHTGSHKINNALGQVLLAQRQGKNRVIAETGAGQHGLQRQPLLPCSGSNASSTWARSTSNGSR